MPKRVLEGRVVSDKADKTVVVVVERRFTHPLLQKTVRRSKHYHAHDEKNACKVGEVVRIPAVPGGSAGTPQLFLGPTCDLSGADGLALDSAGNLYVALNIQGKIVRIDPDGNTTTIAASPGDPLYFPSAIAFGTGFALRKQIFITNFAAFGGTPGIVTMDVGAPGRPLP